MARSAVDWVGVGVGLAPMIALGGVVGYEFAPDPEAATLTGVASENRPRVETLRLAGCLLGSILGSLGFLIGATLRSRAATLRIGAITALAMVAFHMLVQLSGGIVIAGLLVVFAGVAGRMFGTQRRSPSMPPSAERAPEHGDQGHGPHEA